MASADPQQRLRLALSYREHAQHLLRQVTEKQAAATRTPEQFQSLATLYAQHLQRANTLIEDALAAEHQHLAYLQHQLHSAQQRQSTLTRDAAQKRITPAQANEQNRELLQQIIDCKQQLTATENALRANYSKDLGGYIKLPLDEYPSQIAELDTVPAGIALPPSFPLTPIPRPTAPIPIARILFVGIALAIIATAITFFTILPAGPRPMFTAQLIENGRAIAVTCVNEGNQPLDLHAPWPRGAAAPPSNDSPNPAFGIEVYLQEHGDTSYRLMLATDDLWQYQGRNIPGPITIQPGLNATVILRLDQLHATGVEPAAIRLLFTRENGRRIDSFQSQINL